MRWGGRAAQLAGDRGVKLVLLVLESLALFISLACLNCHCLLFLGGMTNSLMRKYKE